MMGIVKDKPQLQCCGKEDYMVEKIVQRENDDRPEEGNRLFKLPKHIKQIGLPGNSPEIYIEDYAEGYLRRLAGSDYTECRVAVLVGEFIKAEGKRYVFVRGAIEAEEVIAENEIRFTSDVWAGVYEKIKRYFPQYEAVGWFLGGPEFLTEITDEIRKIHVDWFGGRDRVLYKIDPVEKDAVFHLYDKGELKQWPGYCVYYEKNEEMQDYLVAGAPPSVDAGYKEPVLAELSKKVGRKIDETEDGEPQTELSVTREPEKREEKRQGKTGAGHGAGIAAAMALLAIGAYALREKELGAAGTGGAVTMNPTPTVAIEERFDTDGEALQTNAKVKPTDAAVTGSPGGKSFLEQDFVPITDEPFVPGHAQGENVLTEPPKEEFPTATPVFVQEEDAVNTDTMQLYIVQSGDTLAAICQNFYGNTSRMEEVKGINQIPDENRIYAGQELYLP